MMDIAVIKPGSRWRSDVCSTEAVVVRPPKADGKPQCGGVDMVPLGETAAGGEIVSGFDGGSVVGKRYKSDTSGVEVLCTKAGQGALGFDGELLTPINAKKLPASD